MTALVELVDPAGNVIQVPEGKNIPRCRCGQAANKPCCDGAHAKCGFVSKDPAPPRP